MIPMKHHALFVIFEKAAKFKIVVTAANYRGRFIFTLCDTYQNLMCWPIMIFDWDLLTHIQPCNYQVSKSQVFQYWCSLRCLKEESQWTWYLLSVYFKIGFLNFSNILCCWYISMCTYTICPFNKWVFFAIKQVFHKLLNYFLCFSEMSM